MAASSQRKTTIIFSGDVTGTHLLEAAVNTDAAASIEIKTLASGANTITVPTGGDTVPTSVTIVPPSNNDTSITVKGVTGDTGVRIHNTDPTTLALDDGVTTFCLTAGGTINGVRLYWT